MDKGAFRKGCLERRGALSPEAIVEKSQRICEGVLTAPWFQGARRVMVYVHFGHEVRTDGLIGAVLSLGKEVVVPVVQKDPKGLIPSLVLDFPGDLAPGVWGILEPRPDTLRPVDPATIDVVLTPGAAFDPQGYRLGYGGGYYDRFLPQLGQKAVTAALAFDLQVVEAVPHDEWDIPVDYIVTESRRILCRR